MQLPFDNVGSDRPDRFISDLQGFDSLEGSGSVTVKEDGTYKIAMAADVINRGAGSVSVGLVSAVTPRTLNMFYNGHQEIGLNRPLISPKGLIWPLVQTCHIWHHLRSTVIERPPLRFCALVVNKGFENTLTLLKT